VGGGYGDTVKVVAKKESVAGQFAVKYQTDNAFLD
jgi:hypothetical protein